MKKPDVIKRLIQEMRDRKAPSVDGSYVLLCTLPSTEYHSAAHPAYTPAQIAVQSKAPHVYFIRDESLPAPYWLSPYRQAVRKISVKKAESDETISIPIAHVIFDVARSRESRKSDFVEVAIPVPVLQAKKRPEAEAYILEQLRGAIAALLFVGEAAPAA